MSDKILNRIKEWREFRKEINSLSEDDQINKIAQYWAKMPTVNFVLNYNEFKKWPTAWELISDGYFDSVAIAYLMMQTFTTLGWDNSRLRLEYIKPDETSDYIMVLIVDGKYVLNYSYNEVYNIDKYMFDKRLIKLVYDDEHQLKEI